LYLRENANIILFLTHHTPSKWIIQEVANVLKQLVSNTVPLDIKRDTIVLNGWVTKTAKLIVDASNVEKNRENQRDRDDQSNKLPEQEQVNEVDSLQQLDYASQLNLLFKTCEILGQILKNRYGSLEKPFKQALMKELFDGPLRGVNFILNLVNEAPEALIEDLSKRFLDKRPTLKKDDANRIAQNLIFLALSNFADGLLARQGEIIGSPKLKDTIDAISVDLEKPTNKLVAIAAQLSYPGNAPIASVEAFTETIKDNVFGLRLVQGIVARHLYMFELPYDQRQRLANAANISVKSQSSIAVRSQDTKKLPGKNYRPTNSKGLLSRLQHSFYSRNKEAIERQLDKKPTLIQNKIEVEIKKIE
jgi:hypothetical protein